MNINLNHSYKMLNRISRHKKMIISLYAHSSLFSLHKIQTLAQQKNRVAKHEKKV